MSEKFISVTNELLVKLIRQASENVVLICPGISDDVSLAIIDAAKTNVSVSIIVDSSANAIRSGYGTESAIQTLALHRIPVSTVLGIRIGFISADEMAISFTPTPQYVEEEPINVHYKNGMVVEGLEKELITKHIKDWTSPLSTTEEPSTERPTVLNEEIIKEIKQDLENRPAIKPDDARRMQVLSSCFQFVEIKFKGARIKDHTFPLNASDLGIMDERLASQVSGRYKLFNTEQIQTLNTASDLNDHLNRIKEAYLINVPKYGSIMISSNRKKFEKATELFEKEVNNIKSSIKETLKILLEDSRKRLIPWIKENLKRLDPVALERVMYPLRYNELNEFIEIFVEKRFPSAEELVDEMSFSVKITNVSDQLSLNNDFKSAIVKATNKSFEELVGRENVIAFKEQ